LVGYCGEGSGIRQQLCPDSATPYLGEDRPAGTRVDGALEQVVRQIRQRGRGDVEDAVARRGIPREVAADIDPARPRRYDDSDRRERRGSACGVDQLDQVFERCGKRGWDGDSSVGDKNIGYHRPRRRSIKRSIGSRAKTSQAP